MYRPTSAGISARSRRNSGQRNDIVRVRTRDDGARREATAALAQVGEAQDRVGEIVARRELEDVDARVAESRAKPHLAFLGGLHEAAAEAAIVRVDEDLLAGFGVLHREQAEV